MSKGSHVNRDSLATKKCVATHTNYFLNFKTALYILQCLSNETFKQ